MVVFHVNHNILDNLIFNANIPWIDCLFVYNTRSLKSSFQDERHVI